jgi:hypothetical protein
MSQLCHFVAEVKNVQKKIPDLGRGRVFLLNNHITISIWGAKIF